MWRHSGRRLLYADAMLAGALFQPVVASDDFYHAFHRHAHGVAFHIAVEDLQFIHSGCFFVI